MALRVVLSLLCGAGALVVPGEPAIDADAIEILIASEDLPVGTLLHAEDKPWKSRQVAAAEAPKAFLTDPADLAGRRLTRAVRAGEAFAPADLAKPNPGMALVDGFDVASFAVAPGADAGGLARPGSRIGVLATRRTGDTFEAFTALSDVPVVAVGAETGERKGSTFSIAVTEKQALTLALAQHHDCRFTVVLRNPDKKAGDKSYDLDAVLRKLSAADVAPMPHLKGRE